MYNLKSTHYCDRFTRGYNSVPNEKYLECFDACISDLKYQRQVHFEGHNKISNKFY